ncbi:class I SAM-dependent methyltransferase [Natrialbaceae archaeon GCM10025810]|uniref:class I SAM-dependent methyltransferase n=1 Tax=Halovalidus salilacus TaxID=3075124 RepID=UPI003614380E
MSASDAPSGADSSGESNTDRDSRGADGERPSARRPMSLEEIRGVYADQADMMARMAWADRLLAGRYRRRVFERAEGRVLDVACGTGTNVPHLPGSVEYVGVDLSPEMLANAEDRFDDLERGDNLLEMDAQNLAFPDDAFDTVVSSLSTCTFPDPVAALNEMNRVCKPDGRVLLLEHGRSDLGPIARFQDWRADAHYEKHGCRWNQDPLESLERSDLEVSYVSTWLAGILTGIRARPA